MSERLSFFVKRESILHLLNPLTKLSMVFAFILITFFSPFRWMAPLLIVPVILLSFIGGVQRQFLNVAIKLILPAVLFMFVMQSVFLPGGETILFSVWIFDVTREAVEKAFITVSRIFVMISSFTILLLTTHPSELMSDLTRRGLPGQFAYVIISTLQIIPQMQAKANTIIAAQRSRGLDTQSSFRKRIGALVPLVGPLVFGSLVEVEERAIAIEARGFTSTQEKTSLYEIPDSRLDKALRWVLSLLVLAAIMSRFLVNGS
jgi:energy-coupling factor transport system permease protein